MATKRTSFEKILQLQSMIDYLLWILEKMHTSIKHQNNIEVMIDQATGFEKDQIINAKKTMRNIKRLKKLYYLIMEQSDG